MFCRGLFNLQPALWRLNDSTVWQIAGIFVAFFASNKFLLLSFSSVYVDQRFFMRNSQRKLSLHEDFPLLMFQLFFSLAHRHRQIGRARSSFIFQMNDMNISDTFSSHDEFSEYFAAWTKNKVPLWKFGSCQRFTFTRVFIHYWAHTVELNLKIRQLIHHIRSQSSTRDSD